MYADRVEADSKRPVKDRLNGSSLDAPSRRRPITGKRQRDDDKWEHDLFDTDGSRLSTHKGGVRDLRLKLQKKGLQSTATQIGAPASSMRDLREKLSGVVTAPLASGGGSKPKPASESSRPMRRSTAVEAPIETKSTNPSHKKKTQQNADDVEGFLESLGLEKYTITFQAEEVDMTALAHMTDEDLKAMGIPMGPRKKILLALESRG